MNTEMRAAAKRTDSEEDRIRAVFALPAHASLPKVSKEATLRYHEYLA